MINCHSCQKSNYNNCFKHGWFYIVVSWWFPSNWNKLATPTRRDELLNFDGFDPDDIQSSQTGR